MKPNLVLIAATFSPYDANGALSLNLIEAYAQQLVQDGVRGIFIGGSTGESALLTTEERLRLTERWCAVAKDQLEVIVHVGHASLEEARILAAHAQRCGAAAVSALAPYYFKPTSTEALVASMAHVAAAAPGLPFYYYHIPVLTGVGGSMVEFLELAATQIPNLGGIKFTHEDLMDYAAALEFGSGRYEIFFGRDEILLSAMALGATSAVGSTYNLWPSVYQHMAEAFARGDLMAALNHQRTARRLIQVGIKYGGLPAFKAMLGWRGLDCGSTRLPLTFVNEEDQKRMRMELEQLGLLGYVVERSPA
ncbi:MAG: dihydrodipicolinate synthase family protein [Meiothermus sp.]|nr:dihydrodipicolinate synthase family protein [Meiothermus sp.]